MTSSKVAAIAQRSIEDAIDAVERQYIAENPNSAVQYRRSMQYLPGGNTRIALYYDPFPIVVERAQGGSLVDLDGHTYTDFSNDLSAGLYGHSEPTIIGALKEALDRGLNYGAVTCHEARLAEAICRRFRSVDRVRFCNSGTEANVIALQLARAITGRRTIVAFSGGYHGSILNYLPSSGRLNVEDRSVQLARFNDEGSVRAAVDAAGADLAAIVVEPMMGSAGGIAADPSFLALLRDLTKSTGAMLIFDEVQTARLSYGGLQEVYGLDPDITTLGKFLGGGLSFGAIGGRADIIDRFDPAHPDGIAHGGTFNNNVLTMVAGHAGLAEVATREALADLNLLADWLRANLREIANVLEIPLAIGGYGSILALHFQAASPRRLDEATTPKSWRKLLHLEMLLHGVYTARRGTLNLSLATTKEDCLHFSRSFSGVLERYRTMLKAML